MKLISMTDFVLQQCKEMPESGQIDTLFKIYNYASFLKQPLTLGMFAPINQYGDFLEKIGNIEDYYNKSIYPVHLKEYKEAKEKIKFINFQSEERYIDDGNEFESQVIYISQEKFDFHYDVLSKKFYTNYKIIKGHYKELKIIEDFIIYGLDLNLSVYF